MDQWLRQNRQQYQLLMALSEFLIARGFNPIPTPPAHDLEFRQDHTLALLDLLTSFRTVESHWPLTVFSTGPLYQARAGKWLETLDVEIFGPNPAHEDMRALALITELIPALATGSPAPACLMALGQVAWLDTALTRQGLQSSQRQEIRQNLMDGHLVEAENALSRLAPTVKPLCTPQPPEPFFSKLAQLVPEIPTHPLPKWPSNWQIEWDLSLTGNWPYYTGMVFSLYLPGIGQPLLNGGRFTITRAGKQWSGVGFTLYLESLMSYTGAGKIDWYEVSHGQ